MAVVTELVTKFSFVGSLSPLKLFNADLAGGIFLIGEFAGAVSQAASSVKAFLDGPLQGAKALQNFSMESGIAIETLQELGFAASVLGSDMNAVQSSLVGLQQKIGEASMKGSEDFARLGISVRNSNGHLKNADQVLNEVRVRFNQLGLSLAEKRTFASALGIDASLIQFLGQTSGAISKLRKQAQELGVLNEKQTETSLKYANALTVQQFAISGLQNQIAVGLAPELTELAESFTELLLDNKDWILEGIDATVTGIGHLIDSFNRLKPFLIGAAGLFVAAKIAAIGFSGVMAILTSPIVIAAAAIGGALLLLDDLVVAFRGGESVIADFIDSFFGLGTTQNVLKSMVQGFEEAIDFLKGLLMGFVEFSNNLFSGDFLKAFGNIASGTQSLFDFFTLKGSDSTAQLAGATGTSSSISNSSVQQSNSITVISSDPMTAGQSVNDALQKQLRNAQDQLNKGGR